MLSRMDSYLPRNLAVALDEALTATTSPADRAGLLYNLTRAFTDYSRDRAPGGEGLDGRDGPERQGLSEIANAALAHETAMQNGD